MNERNTSVSLCNGYINFHHHTELKLRQEHNDALGGALGWRRHIAVQRIHSHHAVLGLVVLGCEAFAGKWGKHDKSNKKRKKEPAAINR